MSDDLERDLAKFGRWLEDAAGDGLRPVSDPHADAESGPETDHSVVKNNTRVESTLVLDLVEEKMMDTNRRWLRPLLAAAAVVVVIAGGAVLLGRSDGKTTVADVPDSTTTVPAAPTTVSTARTELSLDEEDGFSEDDAAEDADDSGSVGGQELPEPASEEVAFLRSLFEAAGGLDGQTVAQIEDTHPWITFDPLDNNRFLAADLNWQEPVAPSLWYGQGGLAEERELAGIPADWNPSAGTFQRDGTILIDPANRESFSSTYLVLMNTGDVLSEIVAKPYPGQLTQSQGSRLISMETGYSNCPYSSVSLAGPAGTTILSEERNEFARMLIPEPGIAMALPYFPENNGCKTTSTVARAWDLTTGEALPDYPLDGLEIARAAVSGDGSRAVVLGPEGDVWVISMETGETITTLGPAEAGHVYLPLAINESGTLAAVAEENGRLTLWHVDSGELIVELTGGFGRGALGIQVGPAMAYDASRVALRSEDELSWTIVSLDPNEWLVSACANGFTVAGEQREAAGLDPDIAC